MSLINKMLQDLDKRGGAGDGAVQSQELKAVPAPERDRRPLMLAGAGVAAAAVLAAGSWYGWQAWQSHRAPAAPVPKVVLNQLPPGVVRATPPSAPIPVPTAAALTEPVSKPVELAQVDDRPAKPVPAKVTATAASRAVAASDDAVASRPRSPVPDTEAHRPERKPAQAEGVSRRELTPKLESDGAYRRALVALQDGRLSVAMADLERALDIDPRNEAARQTYVSLLLENKRTDEAVRQLRLALGIDPRQPGLAMVLARLQLERGGPALATLMATLPYAGNNADYLAFLAGVLQREQRHAEAVRYYRDALQLAPGNGVWWMGLAISLQADQHLPEARDAYTRARAATGMTPELMAFIDRKLEQLGR
jgi:MSHA biogenesis protein MshN